VWTMDGGVREGREVGEVCVCVCVCVCARARNEVHTATVRVASVFLTCSLLLLATR